MSKLIQDVEKAHKKNDKSIMARLKQKRGRHRHVNLHLDVDNLSMKS